MPQDSTSVYVHADGTQELHADRNYRLARMLYCKLIGGGMPQSEALQAAFMLHENLTNATTTL